jgi:hypothetical protein
MNAGTVQRHVEGHGVRGAVNCEIARHFARIFSGPLELRALERGFGIFLDVKQLVLHVLVELRDQRLDAVRLENYLERAVLGIRLVIEKLTLVFQEVRALPAEAKMVPAEADLGVRGVECVSRGVRRSGRDQRKAETAREARSAGFIPIISKIEMVRGPGLAWPRGNGKAESGKRDQKRLWNVKKKKRRGARLRPRFLGRMLEGLECERKSVKRFPDKPHDKTKERSRVLI